jgi:hypothetical protein
VHAVVLGPIPATTGDTPDACRPAWWQFDVLGSRKTAPTRHSGARRPGRTPLRHPKPGSRGHTDITDVVRVGLELPAPDSACPFPAEPRIEVLDRFPLSALNPFLHLSISDRVVLLEDPARDFRRIFPAGVGAIDHLRRPGHITSLTPATDGSRLDPETSFRTLGAPRWFANEPFLPIEAPMAVGNRIGFYTTRVAFHVFQTHRFMRAYVSRGCVTLRTGDLRELRDVLFARTTPIPLFIGAETMPDVYHPFPHEDGLHFVLKPFGPPERPTWRVSGNLYVTEKVVGPPPPGEVIVGVPLDSEARLRQRMTLATEGHEAETPAFP